MTKTLSLYDAKTNLSAPVEEAAAGEEIVIAKNGRPRARLVALALEPKPVRQAGLYEGRIRMSDHFDAPWPEDAAASG